MHDEGAVGARDADVLAAVDGDPAGGRLDVELGCAGRGGSKLSPGIKVWWGALGTARGGVSETGGRGAL